MKRVISIAALAVVLGVAGGVSASGEEETAAPASPDVQGMLQQMQQRIDELEGEVSRLKEGPGENGEAGNGIMDLTNRVESLEGGLLGLNGFQFGGLMYGSYNYNFNSPDSGSNNMRIFDQNHNDFTMDLLQLEVSKETESGVGFHAVLDYGETAGLIQSDWGGDLAHNFEVQQAYMTYTFGVGNGVEMKFGKFATLLGGEVIESPYNPNVSRSFMFGYAIPFTHTGVLFSTALNDNISLTAGVVNGWDNVRDNNNGKTFLGSLGLELGDLAWTFNGVFGAEDDDSGSSKSGVFDTVLTYSPMENVDLLANFDYGTASEQVGGDDADWTGLSGIVTLGGGLLDESLADWSFALRGEWFSDPDGYRTGIEQDLREVTGTFKWQMTENLQARLEFRHDWSNKDVFDDGSGYSDDQDSMIVEFAYLM
ncbi:MAG: outer membrane beta-barrel protein [Desulfurellaceae bacterium]|nr:outer membrane beta-barrel protein [Desulfurellaceae bacterium]